MGGSVSEKTVKGGINLCRERGLTGSAVCPAFNFVENRSNAYQKENIQTVVCIDGSSQSSRLKQNGLFIHYSILRNIVF